MTTCLSGLNNYCPKYHTSCRSQPFNLTCSPRDTKWFEQLRHNCSAISPKFDNRELWSITIFRIQHFTAQSYNQNATSNRISWLEQQSCSSHFIWVLTPFCHRQGDQRGRMKLQEPPSSQPPPPRLFHSTSTSAHSCIYFTFSICLYHAPFPPHHSSTALHLLINEYPSIKEQCTNLSGNDVSRQVPGRSGCSAASTRMSESTATSAAREYGISE